MLKQKTHLNAQQKDFEHGCCVVPCSAHYVLSWRQGTLTWRQVPLSRHQPSPRWLQPPTGWCQAPQSWLQASLNWRQVPLSWSQPPPSWCQAQLSWRQTPPNLRQTLSSYRQMLVSCHRILLDQRQPQRPAWWRLVAGHLCLQPVWSLLSLLLSRLRGLQAAGLSCVLRPRNRHGAKLAVLEQQRGPC